MAFVYSCCFWFSLRLGGIMIATFSVIQGLILLITFCMVLREPQYTRDKVAAWMDTLNLIYVKDYLEKFQTDTEKYISYCIIFISIYIVSALLYNYGAFTCKNSFMVAYILMELFRLILVTVILITWLLVLKQNTMDIGLLIGASVLVTFGLLGMYYLWVCAANLPILINEMDNDEKLAMINKLQTLLAQDKIRSNRRFYNETSGTEYGFGNYNDVFILPNYKTTVPQNDVPKIPPRYTFLH